MRKALIVGIAYYENIRSLSGAVNDAHSVRATLERNADGTRNFAQPNLLTSTSPAADVPRAELRDAIQEIFNDDAEIALLYFSGHGHMMASAATCVEAASRPSTTASRSRTL